MFDDDIMRKINRDANLDVPQLEALRDALIGVGTHFRAMLKETPSALPGGPSNMALTKRVRWLEQKVINPADRLLEALRNDDMFAPYPEAYPEAPDRSAVSKHIEAIRLHAQQLAGDLEDRASLSGSHNTEIKTDILFALVNVFQSHVPKVPLRRGTHNPKHGDTGRFRAMLQLAFAEIIGGEGYWNERSFRDAIILFQPKSG